MLVREDHCFEDQVQLGEIGGGDDSIKGLACRGCVLWMSARGACGGVLVLVRVRVRGGDVVWRRWRVAFAGVVGWIAAGCQRAASTNERRE
jgi:hypothetical protein